jgi:hypothetical protein
MMLWMQFEPHCVSQARNIEILTLSEVSLSNTSLGPLVLGRDGQVLLFVSDEQGMKNSALRMPAHRLQNMHRLAHWLTVRHGAMGKSDRNSMYYYTAEGTLDGHYELLPR